MSRSGISLSRRFWIPAFALIAGVWLAAGQAQAGSIEISPVRSDLSATVRVSVLTVRNTGEDEAVMQVSLLSWPVSDADYAFEPTTDLLVTPTTFRLAAGAQQIVRVGLRGAVPLKVEAAYRLVIEEVPALQEQDTTRMRLVVRHDLPVFVAPVTPPVQKLAMAMDCAPDRVYLRLKNTGDMHLKVLRLTLQEPGSTAPQADWKAFQYLLPGGTAQWSLSTVAPQAKARAYTATAYTELESFAADVQNPCP
jgi:fimbrial chaperone protein